MCRPRPHPMRARAHIIQQLHKTKMEVFFGLAVFLFLPSAIRAVDIVPTEDQINCLTNFVVANQGDDRVRILMSAECAVRNEEDVSFLTITFS